MKIVIFNGSHRDNSNCSCFANSFSEICGNENSITLFNLASMNIAKCHGCLLCEEGEECGIVDDYSELIVPKIMESDLLVFATPTYFNMPSSSMVNFLDRTNNLCDYLAENSKKVFTFISGQTNESSLNDTYKCLHTYYEIMCMQEICDPILHVSRERILLSSEEIKTIKDVFCK